MTQSQKTPAGFVSKFDSAKPKTFAKPVFKPATPARVVNGQSDRDTSELQDMLTYRRAAYSKTLRRFNRRFIEPLFGRPDGNGNYILSVGASPNVAFMAHHDSVHTGKGIQQTEITDGYIHLAKGERFSNCLGADCATGVWLILEMIRANVPGLYVIHANEESGCQGSRALVKESPELFARIEAAISFDRKGTQSVITFQSSFRTASDAFAESLAAILGLGMKPDDGGSYTDSNEYTDVIGECTNLSVGYYSQHSKAESQDLHFAALLADKLIAADWSQLVFSRKPGEVESLYPAVIGKGYGRGYWEDEYSWGRINRRDNWRDAFDELPDESNYTNSSDPFGDMVDLIADHPELVADILGRLGYGPQELAREIGETFFDSSYKDSVQ